MPSGNPTRSDVLTAQSRAVGGAKKRCTKGKSCSATCIDRTEACLVEFPVPASQSLGKARDMLEEKDKEFFGKLREDFKDRRYKEIKDAISSLNEGKYNLARDEIIKFNDGRPANTEAIKVPITWERAQKISKAYDRAIDRALDRVDKARYSGSREKFDKEVAKLRQMYDSVGSKLGKLNEAKYIKWEDYKDTPFLRKIYAADLGGAKVSRRGDDLVISTKIGKHKVTVELSDLGLSFGFKVDGQYAVGPDVSRKDGVQIALAVRSIFNSVVSSMNDGSVITVTPYEGDGKGAKREELYGKYGFKRDGDSMYGKVSRGKIVGSSEEEFFRFTDKGTLNFSSTQVF